MIIINEFLPDPVGADKGKEWIEIVNISENEIDLSNWEIQVAGIRFNRAFKFPTGANILPNQYILLCEDLVESCDFYTSQLAIQNGGKETDGIRILNEEAEVVDTILYDTTNSNNLLNDFGEIEKNENIIEMPKEGCSLARRNFSDTNYSIQDFFVTCSPTPGKKNIENESIVISEVGFNFIEFYSPSIPSSLGSWYLKKSENDTQKIFLKNDNQNTFFSVEIQEPLATIYLYTPQDILFDSFSTKTLSRNFSHCRINSKKEDEFTFCENTEGGKNILKEWIYINTLKILQIDKEDSYIINPCIMYKYSNLFILSDETAALEVECEDCKLDFCFTAEIDFKKESFSKLRIIKENNFRKIQIPTLEKNNYSSLLNKVVFVQGVYKESDLQSSYFSTNVGIVKTKKGQYSQKTQYTFKGILKQDSEMLNLEYGIVVKQNSVETLQTLEETGDPLILLFLFLIPLLFFKIFAKLSTIKFKRYFYEKSS